MAYAVLIGAVEVALFGAVEDAQRFIKEQLDPDDAAEIVEVKEIG